MSSTARSGPRPASPPASTWRWRWSRPISVAATANLIARHFVLYARRPGYQSQFSPMLQAQATADAPFAALIDWMQDHLDRELDVPTLARHAGYSERSFYRKFTEATGKTPAHFVEDLRLDAARTLLSKGLSLKLIAGRVGLKSSARLGQAFERRFGVAPSLFREMHAADSLDADLTAASSA